VPIPDERAHLGNRHSDSHLHQDDQDRDGRGRDYGVHGHAERAGVGVLWVRVRVHCLRYCQQQKQQKTHYRRRHQKGRFASVVPTQLCPE
jgi:hypothetical protein